MPLPFLVWGLIALAAGGATKVGGEAYAEHVGNKARALLADTEKYVSQKQRELARKRRGCLETVASQAQMIRAAVSAPIGPLPETPAELPAELKAAWDAILRELTAVSPTGSLIIEAREDPEFLRKLSFGTYVAQQRGNPNAHAWGAFTAAAYYAFHGVKDALNKQSFYNDAKAACEAARLDADQRVAAMAAVEETLGMNWNNLIVPLMHRAVGPPPDETYAFVLLSMADTLTTQTNRMLQAMPNE